MADGRPSPELSSRIVIAPPGTGQLDAVVRSVKMLWNDGCDARVVAFNSVLTRVLQPRLLRGARRYTWISTYHAFLRELCATVLAPDRQIETPGSSDLWELLVRVTSTHAGTGRKYRHVVVAQGQLLPPDFYLLTRLLGIPVTVFVDPTAPVDAEGSTVQEITHRLGVSTPMVLQDQNVTTAEILRFGHTLVSWPGVEGSPPTRSGPTPRLVHSATVEDEATLVHHITQTSPRSWSVLVALPTRELVTTFVDALRAVATRTVQWHRSDSDVPRSERVDGANAAIRVLTWQSAGALTAETVILAGLQEVSEGSDSRRFRTLLRALSYGARHELVLSYSGQGTPSVVATLPMAALETGPPARTDDDSVPTELPPTNIGTATSTPSEVEHEPPSLHSGTATDAEMEVARNLLANDPLCPEKRRRVLTAAEEVGLSQLARGSGSALGQELPQGFRASLSEGDERAAAFDALVHHNLGLVGSHLAPYAGQGLDHDDLHHHGVLGLMRAIEKFDAGRGNKLSTYATHWIRQAITRGIAEDGRLIKLPVHVHEEMRKVRQERERLMASGRRPTLRALGRATGLTSDTVQAHLQREAGTVSLDTPVTEGSDSLSDLIPAPSGSSGSPGHDTDRRVATDLVKRGIATLGSREAEVLRLRYGLGGGEPRTLEEIGRNMGLTRERIRQIEKRAKDQLADVFQMVVTGTGDLEIVLAQHQPRVPDRQPGRTSDEHDIASGSGLGQLLSHRQPEPDLGTVLHSLVNLHVEAGADIVELTGSPSDPARRTTLLHNGPPVARQALSTLLNLPIESSPPTSPEEKRVVGAALTMFDELHIREVTRSQAPQPTWLLRQAPRTDNWWLRRDRHSPPAETTTPTDSSLSLVEFRGLRQQARTQGLDLVMDELRGTLGLVMGHLLRTNAVRISVDGTRVRHVDPFLRHHPAAQDLGTEHVHADGMTVEVSPHILPHPDTLTPEDTLTLGDPVGWEATQGFYVRCEGRYVSCSGWLGLPGVESTPTTALARIEVVVPAEDRKAWGLNHSAPGPVCPPEGLQPRLASLARLARSHSERIFASRTEDPNRE